MDLRQVSKLGYEDEMNEDTIEYAEEINQCTICRKKKIENTCEKIHIELDSMRTFTHYCCSNCFINLLGALERANNEINNIVSEYQKYWNEYAINKHELKQKKKWFR